MITPTTFEGLTTYNLFLSPVPGFAKTPDHPLIGRWLGAYVTAAPAKFPELIFAADTQEEAMEHIQALREECFNRYGGMPIGPAVQPYRVRWTEDVDREFIDLMATLTIPEGWRYAFYTTKLGIQAATFSDRRSQRLILQPQQSGHFKLFDATWDIKCGAMKVLSDHNATWEIATATLEQYFRGTLKTEPAPEPKQPAYAR